MTTEELENRFDYHRRNHIWQFLSPVNGTEYITQREADVRSRLFQLTVREEMIVVRAEIKFRHLAQANR